MTEKLCPVCKKKNKVSAVFCIYCGALLEFSQDNRAVTRRIGKAPTSPSQTLEEGYTETLEVPSHGIAIYIRDFPAPLEIRDEQEFVIGRKLSDIKVKSFVDLVPFGAYENGVSQRHALIRQAGDGYEVVDLGSTNGTWLEKQRLIPNKPYPFDSGAHIRLGRLCLYAIYQQKKLNK